MRFVYPLNQVFDIDNLWCFLGFHPATVTAEFEFEGTKFHQQTLVWLGGSRFGGNLCRFVGPRLLSTWFYMILPWSPHAVLCICIFVAPIVLFIAFFELNKTGNYLPKQPKNPLKHTFSQFRVYTKHLAKTIQRLWVFSAFKFAAQSYSRPDASKEQNTPAKMLDLRRCGWIVFSFSMLATQRHQDWRQNTKQRYCIENTKYEFNVDNK